jgi:hypothetical protein
MIADAERRKSVIQRVLEGLGQSGAAGVPPVVRRGCPTTRPSCAEPRTPSPIRRRSTRPRRGSRGDRRTRRRSRSRVATTWSVCRHRPPRSGRNASRRLAALTAQAAKELKCSDEARTRTSRPSTGRAELPPTTTSS